MAPNVHLLPMYNMYSIIASVASKVSNLKSKYVHCHLTIDSLTAVPKSLNGTRLSASGTQCIYQ